VFLFYGVQLNNKEFKMAGLIKVLLAFVFIAVIAVGTILGGFVGFIFTFLIAIIFSGMFNRIEKNKLESKRHQEMLKAVKESNNKS